ncbi:MAG: CDP-alcohol phosphatidyltransferase family protein [Bacteroidota bacterium]
MKEVGQHKRVNDILLGPLERPALHWLASHMPAWVTPDLCTVIGIGGAFLTLVGYVLSNSRPGFLWLASLGFLVNWFGDSLDGTLARHRHIERPMYGYFIDHATDALTQLMIFFGLGFSPYVSFNIASLALIGYLVMCIITYLRMYVAAEFKISYGRLGPTESRVVAVFLTAAMYFFGIRNISLGGMTFSAYDIPVLIIALVLFSFFINTAWQETRRLAALGE